MDRVRRPEVTDGPQIGGHRTKTKDAEEIEKIPKRAQESVSWVVLINKIIRRRLSGD